MNAVLIVDDTETVRTDLADALEAAGFRAVSCASVAEARTALRTQPIALAILDDQLPDGTGIELLEQIRRDHLLSELPVLVLATYAEVSERISRLDSSEFRNTLASALAKVGYETMVAANGADGLAVAANARPTAIVVDSVMPDMDGASLIRRLRLDPGTRTTPCLLLTVSDKKEEEVRALEAGADGLVRKEDMDVIVARIRAMSRSSATAMPVEPNSKLAPKRVLTVDDDPDYLEILAGRLRKRGYDVSCAGSGEAAIDILGREKIDCILLDRSMAGMGGVAACKRIKDDPATRDIPLIFLTATESREAVIEGLSVGADDFVSKASGFDVLSARVQAQIRRKQVEDEQRKVREQLLHSELAAAEARAARELAETRAEMAEELARANVELAQTNRELEAFSYSVSHDLRAPLRTVAAFTQALAEDLGDKLDDKTRDHIRRVLAASARMADLIEALLELSRINRAPIGRHRVDLSAVASSVCEELARREPRRKVELAIAPNLLVAADGRLVRILLDNLLNNSWKFTARAAVAQIEVGAEGTGEAAVFFVRDNGAGFDMSQASRLFTPFHRLHTDGDFKGTGIGLATARRIVERHGGRIWAEGSVGAGAKISFTLPPER
jgi:two-component system NtrC family sensor kinase